MLEADTQPPARLACEIAAAIEPRFGVLTPVIVKSASEFATIVDGNPIVPVKAERSRFLVAFAMDQDRLRELEALRTLLQPDERLAVSENAAYLHCASGLLTSTAGKARLGRLGQHVTTRNWGTTLKLSWLAAGAA